MRCNPEGRGSGESDDDFDEAPTQIWAREGCPRVLVAEDDRDLRHMIVACMQRDAFDVLEAGSGEEMVEILTAITRAQAHDALDLLVMEVQLPGASGLEITRALRAAEWMTPILLIAARPDRELLDEASRLGVRVLRKPLNLESLSAAAIAELLASRQPGPRDAGDAARV